MALFNVTLHGLADPFEWSSQPHTQVASQQDEQDETDGSAADFGARAAAMADLSDWTGSNSTITAGRRSSSNSRNPSITSADIHSRRGSSGGGNAPSSNPRTELISGRRGTQRPRSTRSAAIRASEVPVSEGLVLPPVPGALPPVPALVRGNTAPTPKFLRWKPAHGGSHQKFVELRTKHRHNKAGPNDIYTPQLTTTHDYGRWLRTCMPQDEQWVLERRRGIAASEVTKFVDEMAKTNKDFSLF